MRKDIPSRGPAAHPPHPRCLSPALRCLSPFAVVAAVVAAAAGLSLAGCGRGSPGGRSGDGEPTTPAGGGPAAALSPASDGFRTSENPAAKGREGQTREGQGGVIQRLRSGEDPDVLAGEMKEALRKGAVTAQQASVWARDSDPEIAALGARVLAGAGTPEALHLLVRAIGDATDPELRNLLADEAAPDFDPAMAGPLIDLALGATDDAVLAMARQALAGMADRSILAALRDRMARLSDARLATRLGDAIRLIENESLTTDLIALSSTTAGRNAAELRHAAIEALGGIGTGASARHLLAALGTATEEDRASCARAVARIRNEGALEELIRAAAPAAAGAPGSAVVQAAAIEALGNYDLPDLRGLLHNAILYAGDAAVRKAAEESLKRVEENIAAVSHASEDAP